MKTGLSYNMPERAVVFDFIDMPMEEARAYYEWYTASLGARSEVLRRAVSEQTGEPLTALDFSAESLRIIWAWFLRPAQTARNPRYRGVTALFSGAFRDAAMREPERVFTEETNAIIGDIGMYIAKALTVRYPALSFAMLTKPRNYIRVKAPVIVGFIDDNPAYPKPFHPELAPSAFVAGVAQRIFENRQRPDDLYDEWMKWARWIPREG